MAYRYDGTRPDRDDTVENMYQESARWLAEELYDARRLAIQLFREIDTDSTEGLPEWVTDNL